MDSVRVTLATGLFVEDSDLARVPIAGRSWLRRADGLGAVGGELMIDRTAACAVPLGHLEARDAANTPLSIAQLKRRAPGNLMQALETV